MNRQDRYELELAARDYEDAGEVLNWNGQDRRAQ